MGGVGVYRADRVDGTIWRNREARVALDVLVAFADLQLFL